MIINRFDLTDYERSAGKEIFGRIKEYSRKKGYGYIFTEDGKDIFLSSYDLGDLEYKVAFGTTLKFIPELWNDKYKATKITVVSNESFNEVIECPNDICFKPKNLEKFDYISGRRLLKEKVILENKLIEHGYYAKDLDCVFFRTNKGDEYRFFQQGAPIQGDGQLPDLKKFYKNLVDRFYKLY